MATKKAKGKDVVVAKAAGLPADMREELARLAREEQQRRPSASGNVISIRGGAFKYQGADLPEELDVIVVDYVFKNAWYDRPFDPDNQSPPACFAISPTIKDLAPPDEAPDKQSDACADCWANEFGSDGRGKGKACRNGAILGVVPAGEEGEGLPEEVEIAVLDCPPKSLPNLSRYISKVNAGGNPLLGVVTRVTFDKNYDYPVLRFEVLRQLGDREKAVLIKLRSSVREIVSAKPDVSGYEPPKGKGPRKGGPAKKGGTARREAPRGGSRFS